MSREAEYRDVAIDFVKAARYPQSAFEFAADLECVGKHGGKVPLARANVWKAVLEQLIAEGKLEEIEQGVRVPLEPEKPVQLSLF